MSCAAAPFDVLSSPGAVSLLEVPTSLPVDSASGPVTSLEPAVPPSDEVPGCGETELESDSASAEVAVALAVDAVASTTPVVGSEVVSAVSVVPVLASDAASPASAHPTQAKAKPTSDPNDTVNRRMPPA